MSYPNLTLSSVSAGKMHHLQSSRVGLTSLLSTISRLPAKEVMAANSYVPPPPEQLKFKRNIRFLKSTEMHVSRQSLSIERKPCMRVNSQSYIDSFQQDNPEQSRRELRSGEFNTNSQKTHYRLYGAANVPLRTAPDLGVERNRKRPVQPHSAQEPVRNPITKGDLTRTISREILWKEERRLRDNGRQVKQTLQWNTDKQCNSYARIHAGRRQNR